MSVRCEDSHENNTARKYVLYTLSIRFHGRNRDTRTGSARFSLAELHTRFLRPGRRGNSNRSKQGRRQKKPPHDCEGFRSEWKGLSAWSLLSFRLKVDFQTAAPERNT